MAGKTNGAAALISAKYPLALYVHHNPYRNDKVVTTLLQPCHNLATTLYFETVARL